MIPTENMASLLSCDQVRLPVCAAIAEWQHHPEGKVRPELRDLWENAICRATDFRHYELPEIVSSDAQLCFKWMRSQIESGATNWQYSANGEWLAAVKPLTRDQRHELLQLFDQQTFNSDIFDALVAGDLGLVQDWMNGCSDDYFRLRPLMAFDTINETWVGRAICALNAGSTPDQIANLSVPYSYSFSEPSDESRFKDLVDFYTRLSRHSDRRLHKAAERGLKWTRDRMNEERASTRRREVYGAGP
jgi:hypothetical protein